MQVVSLRLHQFHFHSVLVCLIIYYTYSWYYSNNSHVDNACRLVLMIIGMAKVESQTKHRKRIIIQKSKICNYGRSRYLYENAVAREPGYTLSRSFQNSINYQLPLHYNERAYMQFIENWGTVHSV